MTAADEQKTAVHALMQAENKAGHVTVTQPRSANQRRVLSEGNRRPTAALMYDCSNSSLEAHCSV